MMEIKIMLSMPNTTSKNVSVSKETQAAESEKTDKSIGNNSVRMCGEI
jgi:hypothetical protein